MTNEVDIGSLDTEKLKKELVHMSNRTHLIHRTLDIGSGFLIALMIQYFIFPMFGLYPRILDMIYISLIFTVVGITRSYIWSKYIFKYSNE